MQIDKKDVVSTIRQYLHAFPAAHRLLEHNMRETALEDGPQGLAEEYIVIDKQYFVHLKLSCQIN